MRRAALGFAAALCAIAHADATTPYDEKGGQWGVPIRIVVPDYPKAALAAGRTGYVDVSGVVDGLRILGEVRAEPDVPANADMAEAVREVIRYWRFQPPTGPDCAPSRDRVVNRVWFEAAEGKPHVSVSMPKPPDKPVEVGAAEIALLQARLLPAPAYPSRAVRKEVEAIVYARVDFAPDGHVTQARAKAYSLPPDSELDAFQDEVIRALKRWQFQPLRPGETEERAVCREFVFSLKG